jgi:hypothetical protein
MDKILNRARQAYKQFSNKPTDTDINDVIEAAQDLKDMTNMRGWKRIESFMERQREGSEQLLDTEIGTLHLITIPKIFNAFLKYLYILQERRAYKKIGNYVRLTIQRGDQYAQRRIKEEERRKSPQNP